MAVPEHEKLDVYHRAIDVIRDLDAIRVALRRRPDLRDQLARASASIALNIAEGASEFSGAEKARFYRMARRSSAECMAILDVAAPEVPRHGAREAKRKLVRISSMLTRIIQACAPPAVPVPVRVSVPVPVSVRVSVPETREGPGPRARSAG